MTPLNDIIIDRRPWGRACGLLVSSTVMLIGIAREVSPSVIVLRAFAAGVISAVCIRGLVRLLQIMADVDSSNADH